MIPVGLGPLSVTSCPAKSNCLTIVVEQALDPRPLGPAGWSDSRALAGWHMPTLYLI